LPERALAWVYTGPPGHLWGAVADIGLMWMRWQAGRLRARLSVEVGRSARRSS
jgi:hypothetical protein